jgi:hypothetical protein
MRSRLLGRAVSARVEVGRLGLVVHLSSLLSRLLCVEPLRWALTNMRC